MSSHWKTLKVLMMFKSDSQFVFLDQLVTFCSLSGFTPEMRFISCSVSLQLIRTSELLFEHKEIILYFSSRSTQVN